MSVSPFPPIPVQTDVERAAPYWDFVETGALERLLLGSMPTAGETGRLVNGRPPRGEFAGFGEGMMPAPVEVPLAFPVAVSRQRPGVRREPVDVHDPSSRAAMSAAMVPSCPERVPVGGVEDRLQADLDGDRATFRRPPAPRPAAVDRRAAPPCLLRPVADPEDAFGVSQPRVSGIWVLLSSAAASIVLLVLTSVGVNRYGPGRNEPGADPVVPGVSEGVAESLVVPPRPSRLAASAQEAF